MPTLQVRDLPEDIYQELVRQAEKERRSLAQQAIVVLAKAAGHAAGTPIGCHNERRRAILADIRRTVDPKKTRHLRSPVDLIREDRDR